MQIGYFTFSSLDSLAVALCMMCKANIASSSVDKKVFRKAKLHSSVLYQDGTRWHQTVCALYPISYFELTNSYKKQFVEEEVEESALYEDGTRLAVFFIQFHIFNLPTPIKSSS